MAITRPDVSVPKQTWVNLYAASSITVGTAVSIYNKGSYPCQLVIKATAPTVPSMGVPLYPMPPGNFASVAASEVGLWAYSDMGTTLLVQE